MILNCRILTEKLLQIKQIDLPCAHLLVLIHDLVLVLKLLCEWHIFLCLLYYKQVFLLFLFFSLVKIGSLYENQIIFLDTLLHIFICHLIRIILNGQLFIVKLYGQVVYVHLKKILLITLKRWKLGFPKEATLTRLLKMKWKKYFLWEQK